MAADSNPDKTRVRCHHCAGPLSMEMETSEWTVAPFMRDSFSMTGSAVGGTTSAVYGFNHVMPIVRRWVKGPMWVHFLIGAPPVIVFPSVCRLCRRCRSSLKPPCFIFLPCSIFIMFFTTTLTE
ncbi:hypothetical protein LWI29_019138 [Acer saccharum]|uniref:Transmembrane protein n=1 Tax=Acer saccharum TaxID=4024 RepID=A0AA39SEU4_ACESA|nr:hypothetical protein LWI29_019138 [Acer saccharum]